MTAQSKPLTVGERIACYTILAVLKDAPSGDHRWYRAQAACCGIEVERKEHSLIEARRKGAQLCHRCARQAANFNRAASYGFHERFGPVRVIDRGPEKKTWRVVWDCCGKESTIGQAYLNRLRVEKGLGRDTVCLACSIKRSRLLAKERERPNKDSLRKKDLLPILPLPPMRPRDDRVILTPEAAQLPIGIIPAAIAWPRPGRASA